MGGEPQVKGAGQALLGLASEIPLISLLHVEREVHCRPQR